MNKLPKIKSQAELEQLIERYFDGETSLQEEQILQQALADCPWSSETIDEARFTMGYFAVHIQEKERTSWKSRRRHFIGIAASIAAVLAIGLPILHHSLLTPQSQYIAYVNGKVIADNEKAVMSLIAQDLSNMDMATHEMDNAIADDMNEMGIATSQMTDELSSLGEAIELD